MNQCINIPNNQEMDEILTNTSFCDQVKRGLINLHKINPDIKREVFNAINVYESGKSEPTQYMITSISVYDSRQNSTLLNDPKTIIQKFSADRVPEQDYINQNITQLSVILIEFCDEEPYLYISFGVDNNPPTPCTIYGF